MGGNALKNVKTRRYQKDEYHELESKVLLLLKGAFPYERFEVPKSYTSKESFGDLDIVYTNQRHGYDLVGGVAALLGSKELVRNGPYASMDYQEIQIDLIKASPEWFDYGIQYFSHNDLGNLRGRIFHKFGMKHGHNGLFYKIRDPQRGDHVIHELLLTDDHTKALSFLELEHVESFETLIDIYEHVIGCKYFNPSIYQFENINAVARIRDKKRSTYTGFVKYIEGMNPEYYYQFDPKESYRDWVLDFFGKQAEYDRIMSDYNLLLERKKRFNGDLVRSTVLLDGKELGMFMQFLVPQMPDVLQMNQAGIVELIRDKYAEYSIQ